MTTELTNIKDLDFNTIAALTGAYVKENVILPRLNINREPEDDTGKTLPMGHFVVSQNDTKLFSSKALFRLFINAYQYSEYSPTEKNFTNRSVIIKNFNEEALDMKGGLACGKVPFSRLSECSAEEQLHQKQIKCYRLMYGLLTFPDHKDVTNLPVMWKLSSSSFMAPKEALETVTKLKHQYFEHYLELSTKRNKMGSTIYYTPEVSVNLKDKLPLSETDIGTFRMFQEVIDKENKYVKQQWQNAKKATVNHTLADLGLDLNDPVDDL